MNAHFKGKYEREKQMIEERERYVQRMSNHMDEQGSGDLVEEEVGREVQGDKCDSNKTERKKKEKSLKEKMKKDINQAQLARETICGLNFTGIGHFSHLK